LVQVVIVIVGPDFGPGRQAFSVFAAACGQVSQ
jgi:AP-3 complex subunit beta